uniref:Uncharacterized protein n=1 Tax=viral metagenome TaxID=1070528 RepID=A0A6M3XX00_9ZZZZ
MTKELERAAEEASKATGLGVEAIAASGESIALVEVYEPIDGPAAGMPVAQKEFSQNTAAALAYLEGLAQGAQIQRVRHAPLVELVAALGRTVAAGNGDEVVPVEIGLRIIALRNALAELEV